MEEVHGGARLEFEMKIIQAYQNNPLCRQVHEGVNIREEVVDYLMNSREEFHHSREEFHQPGKIGATFGVMVAEEVKNGVRYMQRTGVGGAL